MVGAVHIAQALVPFAVPCGFAVTVVDPRRSFASDERFPNVEISTEWPDEAMDEFKPDSRTAVVTLTHDPKLDDPALDRALKSQAFYIGALGSRRTHAARLKRLRELGHQDNALSRIRGPVGLNIEAVTAPEIAAVDHRRDRRRSPQRAAAAETRRHEVRPGPAGRGPRRHHGAQPEGRREDDPQGLAAGRRGDRGVARRRPAPR